MPFDGPDGHNEALRSAALALRPRAVLWPSEWAAQRRVLTGESSANTGRWKNETVPFARKIMDALDERHPAWMVVFMASRQVAKSEIGINWAGQTIDEAPAPMSVLFPGANLGKSYARLRLNPMIEATPTLREKIPRGNRNDKGDTLLQKVFPGGAITIGSTYVATDMSSRAVGKLIVDDADRFQREAGDEGDWLEIALMGLATFSFRRKVYLNSSPGIESLSVIKPWWLRSSQGHFYVPCVHCGTMQYLVWEQLKWAKGKPQEAAYECSSSSCAKLIAEHNKTDMLRAGDWQHDHPELERSIIGFHANGLMTPDGLGYKWAEHAAAWERSERDPAKVKVFQNTRLGETHADPNEKLDWEALKGRAEPFKLRSIPQGCLLLTAGVDVQKRYLALQIIGWGRNESAWTIDYRTIEGDPTRDEVWAKLDDQLAAEIVNSFGVPMRIAGSAIDAGYLQYEVLAFVRRKRARNIIATKGSGQLGRRVIGTPTAIEAKGRGVVDKRGDLLYSVGESTSKAALFDRLRADGSAAIPDRHVHFSADLDEEYFRGMASEVFDPHKRRFVKVYERNEPLDTFNQNMIIAMHSSIRIHRYTEGDWQRLEAMYEPKGAKSGVTPNPTRSFLPLPARTA